MSGAKRFGVRHRRGFSIVYLGLSLIALLAIISLAVDLGRVRTTRAQMQAGTDAAAFAAVMQMPSVDFTAVQDAAIDVASKNFADNKPVVVERADVEFGKWDANTRTFTVLDGDGSRSDPRHSADAVRVTARQNIPLYLATVLGVTQTQTHTVAAAYIRGGPSRFGIVGLDFIAANGNPATIDSYPAATASYSKATARDFASVASNGDIDLQNGDVLGDARPGIGKTVTSKKNGGATGWTANLQTPLVYPNATVPGGTAQLPNTSNPIPGGTYKTTDFPLNKNTTFSGPVTIYVAGSVSLKGNTIISYKNLPANLQILVVGAGPVDLNGKTALYAHIYAPQAPLTINGTPDIYGTIVAKSITYKGTSDIHYDESLGDSGVPYRSALVE